MDRITGIKMTFKEFKETVEIATDGVATAIKDRIWFFGDIVDKPPIEEKQKVECLAKYLNVNSIDQIIVNCDENDLNDTVIIVYQ